MLLLVLILYGIVLSAALVRAGLRSQFTPPGNTPRSQPTRVLIIGATGGTGRQLVLQALERGYTVTALVRNPSRLRTDHPKLRIIQGDVLDYAMVEAAMHGQDAVLSALGHRRFYYPNRILSQGTLNILRAMEAQRVPRLICTTSLGIGDSVGRLGLLYTFFTIPVVLPFYFWDKTRQERIIGESKVEWVIVRPGMLTNGGKRGQVRHGHRVGSFLWTVRISRADVADFMLGQLTSDAYLRAAPGVAW